MEMSCQRGAKLEKSSKGNENPPKSSSYSSLQVSKVILNFNFSLNFPHNPHKMSQYNEEYLKNKLTEKLAATHVVSFDWNFRNSFVCFVRGHREVAIDREIS
jgi:hypothetical protein